MRHLSTGDRAVLGLIFSAFSRANGIPGLVSPISLVVAMGRRDGIAPPLAATAEPR